MCLCLCVTVCVCVWLSVLSAEGEIRFLKMSHEWWGFYCSPDNFYSTPRAVYICGNWTGFPRKQHHFLWLFTLKVLSSLFRFSLGEGAFERHLTGQDFLLCGAFEGGCAEGGFVCSGYLNQINWHLYACVVWFSYCKASYDMTPWGDSSLSWVDKIQTGWAIPPPKSSTALGSLTHILCIRQPNDTLKSQHRMGEKLLCTADNIFISSLRSD